MSDSWRPKLGNVELPSRSKFNGKIDVPAPTYETFTQRFGNKLPKPDFLESDFGTTAVYNLRPPGQPKRRLLLIHGAQTPALGLVPLARELQKLDQDLQIVLYDLWGHGLTSTPFAPHAPHLFHFQALQVLASVGWAKAHIAGFSLGGRIAVSFALENPRVFQSLALLAPAGMIPEKAMGAKLMSLKDRVNDPSEAAVWICDWLEGKPLQVPEDWRDKFEAGQPVAEALRKFALDEHDGYPLSLVSIFRESPVYGCQEQFEQLGCVESIEKIGILAEFDDICTEKQLADAGFTNVHVVKETAHNFVRTKPQEVAEILLEFWKRL